MDSKVNQNEQGTEKVIQYKTMNMNNSEITKLCVPFLTYRISYTTNVDFANRSIFQVSVSHIKSNFLNTHYHSRYDRKLDLPLYTGHQNF